MNKIKFLSGTPFLWSSHKSLVKYRYINVRQNKSGYIEKYDQHKYPIPLAVIYVSEVTEDGFFYCSLDKRTPQKKETDEYISFSELEEDTFD